MAAARRPVVCTCDACTRPAPNLLDRLTLAAALLGFALLPGRALFHLLTEALS